jgi:dTDP-4-dehydrorhamnose 3,5-epimerase
MQIQKTSLDGVLLIKPDVFEDPRGEYVEIYNESIFKENGINIRFVQDDMSMSCRNVLRGIHADRETWKLVSCLLGRFYLVIVNCVESSPGFGQWFSVTLSDRSRQLVLVPPGHGVAHLALEDKIIFHYKQSTNYNPSNQATYRYDDPRFKIWWPPVEPILSRRDQEGRYVS